MINLLKNNRGMALMLTVLIISLLLASTLQFNTDMRSDLYAATNLRDGVRIGYAAMSAFNLAKAVLYMDGQESDFDSKHESWARLAAISEYSSHLFSGDKIGLQVVDHSGRIQINAISYAETEGLREKQKEILRRLLKSEEFDLNEEDVGHIIEAIEDWIDEDDEVTGFGGAESSYYQSLEKPYHCRNAPLEFVEDLLFVKGITKELFYGTAERPGISKFLTPYGIDGKVNINTADPLVLVALSEQIDLEMVDNIIAYREDEENDLADVNWYKNVSAISSDIEIDTDLITVTSIYFEVTADAFLGAMTKKVTGVIKREAEKKPEVISWKIE